MRQQSQGAKQRRFELGFRSSEDKKLCEQAAEHAGAKSLNAWIAMIVVAAARLELKCD